MRMYTMQNDVHFFQIFVINKTVHVQETEDVMQVSLEAGVYSELCDHNIVGDEWSYTRVWKRTNYCNLETNIIYPSIVDADQAWNSSQ